MPIPREAKAKYLIALIIISMKNSVETIINLILAKLSGSADKSSIFIYFKKVRDDHYE